MQIREEALGGGRVGLGLQSSDSLTSQVTSGRQVPSLLQASSPSSQGGLEESLAMPSMVQASTSIGTFSEGQTLEPHPRAAEGESAFESDLPVIGVHTEVREVLRWASRFWSYSRILCLLRSSFCHSLQTVS